MANRNSPNTDGQIGMEDIVISDLDMYKAVKKWHGLQIKVPNANKVRKDAGDAKKDVVEKLTLTDNPVRFRFVVEEKELVYTIVAKPPAEKEKTTEGKRTIHFNHRLEVDTVEK